MRAYHASVLTVFLLERIGYAALGYYVTHSGFDEREDDFRLVEFRFTHLFPIAFVLVRKLFLL